MSDNQDTETLSGECCETQESQDPNSNPVRTEEAKLKAKYPSLGQKPGGSDFLMKRLQKGQKYFDSGDYNMAKAKMKNKQLPAATGPEKSIVTGMLVKLNLDERGEDMSVISSVARELFSDGITNWGRIASLLAFGAVVARYEASERANCVSLVADEISSYLMYNQKEWLLKNKSWDGFVEFFHIPDPETSVRSALTTFVTVAGIGAVLAYMTR
ncbi:hypothetical protein QTP86_030215 [Hemibagrus guttatus]|nr:hypothetical protein QTP86_030215 [Hemibagrus guttatus]